ncbi:MAG: Uncharacterised protein [Prochlorococcus marinus str. MIT 9215]|nr:MAG: Uncharacterised protein [Prochlorococcus marinus str. MIT 9215]
MSKRRLSDQFRDQLGSLGESLAKHTRSLESHLERQEYSLLDRQQELEHEQQQLLSAAPDTDDQLQQVLAPFLQGDFKLMTVVELRKFCTSQGLRKVSKLKKPELLKLLQDSQLDPPPLSPEKVIKKLKRAELELIVSYFVSNAL